MKIEVAGNYETLWGLRKLVYDAITAQSIIGYFECDDKQIEIGEKFIKKLNRALKKVEGHDCQGDKYLNVKEYKDKTISKKRKEEDERARCSDERFRRMMETPG